MLSSIKIKDLDWKARKLLSFTKALWEGEGIHQPKYHLKRWAFFDATLRVGVVALSLQVTRGEMHDEILGVSNIVIYNNSLIISSSTIASFFETANFSKILAKSKFFEYTFNIWQCYRKCFENVKESVKFKSIFKNFVISKEKCLLYELNVIYMDSTDPVNLMILKQSLPDHRAV